MTATSDWVIALATVVVAATAIISIYYNHKLISVSIAKDKPFVRAYIQRTKNPSLPPKLFVKNE